MIPSCPLPARSKLLRPDQGDPQPHEFLPCHEFTLALVSKADHIPSEMVPYFSPIKIIAEGQVCNEGIKPMQLEVEALLHHCQPLG